MIPVIIQSLVVLLTIAFRIGNATVTHVGAEQEVQGNSPAVPSTTHTDTIDDVAVDYITGQEGQSIRRDVLIDTDADPERLTIRKDVWAAAVECREIGTNVSRTGRR